MDTIFDWCVDVLVYWAGILGITYKEINVWVFVIIWPIVTLDSNCHCLLAEEKDSSIIEGTIDHLVKRHRFHDRKTIHSDGQRIGVFPVN